MRLEPTNRNVEVFLFRIEKGTGYVHNSPLANVDPDGQGIFGDILGVVGMFFGIPFPVGWVIGEDVDLRFVLPIDQLTGGIATSSTP